MDVQKTALGIKPADSESRAVIMPDADNFRYHIKSVLSFRKKTDIPNKISKFREYSLSSGYKKLTA